MELSTTEDTGDTEEESCSGLCPRVLSVLRGGEFHALIYEEQPLRS
jgi:hypothetical protein